MSTERVSVRTECQYRSYEGLSVRVEAAMISFLRASSISWTMDSCCMGRHREYHLSHSLLIAMRNTL